MAASCSFSLRERALMQPADRVESGGHGAFLPAAEEGGVFAGEGNAPVDLAQIVVMRGARLVAPHAETSHGERRSMPRHRHAVIEFLVVLRVDPAAVLDSLT